MISFIWPLILIVVSNTVYQICTKTVPEGANPFATLTATYAVGAVVCAVLFFVTNHGGNLIKEYAKLNWSPFVLGLVIVGLEAGYMYAYKAGWQVSTLPIVQSAFLAVALIAVGAFLYHENVTWNKIAGIIACIAGLFLINMK